MGASKSYPNEKRMHRVQIRVTHMTLQRHLGIGFCLSFHPSNANLVATNPTRRDRPKRIKRTRAIGTQTIILTHSYNPLILGVWLRNGSTGEGGGRDRASTARKSKGFSAAWEYGPMHSMSRTTSASVGRRGEVRSLLESAMVFEKAKKKKLRKASFCVNLAGERKRPRWGMLTRKREEIEILPCDPNSPKEKKMEKKLSVYSVSWVHSAAFSYHPLAVAQSVRHTSIVCGHNHMEIGIEERGYGVENGSSTGRVWAGPPLRAHKWTLWPNLTCV